MTTPNGNGFQAGEPDPQFLDYLRHIILQLMQPSLERLDAVLQDIETRQRTLSTDADAIAQKAKELAKAEVHAEIEKARAQAQVQATPLATQDAATPAKPSLMDWIMTLAQTDMGTAIGQRLVDRILTPAPTNDLDLFLGLLDKRPLLANLVPQADPTQYALKAGVDGFATGLKTRAVAGQLVAGPTAPLVEAILPKDSSEPSELLPVMQNQPTPATPEQIRLAAALPR